VICILGTLLFLDITWLSIPLGGLIGWHTKGGLDPAFEAVAFELETSTTTAPKYGEAKSGFGYHIIMVEGKK
jgi:NIMA-interacting peptidyl-prolyl cis-trans isomerase 4